MFDVGCSLRVVCCVVRCSSSLVGGLVYVAVFVFMLWLIGVACCLKCVGVRCVLVVVCCLLIVV